MRTNEGLACKISGFHGDVGFVFSKAEMQKLEDLRKSIEGAGKAARGGATAVAAGLGAVAAGLVVSALARKQSR